MTEFQMRLLEKIEELTLHVLEQQETREKQQQAINVLEKRLGPTQGDEQSNVGHGAVRTFCSESRCTAC